MIDNVFEFLGLVEAFFWSRIGFFLIILSGLYFSIKSRFFQLKVLASLPWIIRDAIKDRPGENLGTNPVKLYFASVGGMVGLGNIVGIITALMIGGPGSMFWLWIASISGMLIKYSEIYLGVLHRVPNDRGGYDGGPMYYLQKAFSNRALPSIVAVLLCIYGVEVYQFMIVSETLSNTFSIDRYIVIAILMMAIFYTAHGGIQRLANICIWLMPAVMILYVSMCTWVLIQNFGEIPAVLKIVFQSAFSGHAPLGGFVGSTFVLAAQQGISRAVYSGDIGVGFDATIQSETRTIHPGRQARLAIFALATDTFLCSMSMFVVLVTGVWNTVAPINPSQFVAVALEKHFPYMEIFMALFFFISGFTTLIGFFTVGLKSARFVSPKWGPSVYMLYAAIAFPFFAYVDQSRVILIMSLAGGMLLLFNIAGIMRLRHQIEFGWEPKPTSANEELLPLKNQIDSTIHVHESSGTQVRSRKKRVS